MRFQRLMLSVLMSVLPLISVSAQVLQPGEAVLTCFSDNNATGPVMAVFDIRNPAANSPGVNKNWPAPSQHLSNWTRRDFGGEIFGIALDDASPPNIYVTPTVIYKSSYMGIAQTAAGSGQVYKIDGNSGAVSPFGLPLPNTGQGLGNIGFDAAHRQFFVTNFSDGKIYRLNMTGAQAGPPFDPFGTAPVTPGGYAPLGQRLWGVGVFRGRVYFGLWSSDFRAGPPNSVWSVAIDPLTGDFSGGVGSTADVILPLRNGMTMPVSDIEFSSAGKMLLAENGMRSTVTDIDRWPHESRVLEYFLSGNTWIPSPNVFNIGVYQSQTNAAGGVDYSCPLDNTPAEVVATGDALHLNNPDTIYGIQILPDTGGSVANSYLVDADGNVIVVDKTQIGDVDVYNTCDKGCAAVTFNKPVCADDRSGDTFITFQIKNLTPDTIYHLFISGLPAGVTASPNYVNLSATPILPGGTATIGPIRIHGASTGSLGFTISIHNKDVERCCSIDVKVDIPLCECGEVMCQFVSCSLPGPTYTASFILQHLSTTPATLLFVTPLSPASLTVSPNIITPLPPLQFGSSMGTTVQLSGVSPGDQACVTLSTHDASFDECCSIKQCFTIPKTESCTPPKK